MKTKQNRLQKILGLLILVTLTLTACSSAMTNVEASASEATVMESVSTDATSEQAIADASAVSSEDTALTINANGLNDAEIAGLLFMREEEKLARDVYTTLYGFWNLPLFQNITSSEQSHMDAVLYLLDNYGIDDPAANTALGEFVNADLQKLYTDLIDLGSQSLADALKVGAAIEEIDILDLQDNLASLNNAAIQQVYENLLSGSENHLRAFTSTLERQTGETYAPQYLNQDAYDAIIGDSIQTGSGAGIGGGKGAGRKP
jgi:hypothetical protein